MERIPPLDKLAKTCYITKNNYHKIYEESLSNNEEFWSKTAQELISWKEKWSKVRDGDFLSGEIKWFINGKLNVCHNCIDRHLANNANKTALIWVGNEPNEVKTLTYEDLYREVNAFASLLCQLGIKKGDRVAIYLPMLPTLPIAMLACARIGAIHSVIFAGFSSQALAERINDCQAKVLITADFALRGTKKIPLKEIADKALEQTTSIEKTILVKRTGEKVYMNPNRDIYLDEALQYNQENNSIVWVDSEDPLFILYTSGSTGKPKGLVHTSGGYLTYVSATHKYIFDYHPEDIYFCAADIGWITGHSYIVYGPLANGATSIMFESIPTYPDPGRYWSIIEKFKVNTFYTAPTAIRALQREGDQWVKKYDRSSLKILGTVGEPINRDAWLWYWSVVGEKNVAVIDTWWQTETGGIMIAPFAGATDLKPGSATTPFFGIKPTIVNEDNKEIYQSNKSGFLCIDLPWPGIARTIYGDHQRYINTYFERFNGRYFSGDSARIDEDGYFWIEGRVDDVINVSGHRLGTREIESSICHNNAVVEAAVIGVPDDIKGTKIFAYCVLIDPNLDSNETALSVRETVKEQIGPIAVPDLIAFCSGLPKTRSGKIMRRILRKLALNKNTEELGDLTTLADPIIIDKLKEAKVYTK